MIVIKDKEPLISIIMGVYNARNTIDKCIQSIQSQTYLNWEFIICDDCSIDGTYEILQNYSLNDSRIIVLRNESNIRLAASLNRCLERAKGKYIARQDADDFSLPTRLEKQLMFMEKNTDIDCCGTGRLINDGTFEQEKMRYRGLEEYPDKEILLRDTPFAHPTIMIKKEVLDELKGYTVSKETIRAEDLDLWFRFFAKGYCGYNIQEALYIYQEKQEDFKKRSLHAGIQTMKVFYLGYQLLGFPKYKYVYALKPVLAALVPNQILKKYHETRDKIYDSVRR